MGVFICVCLYLCMCVSMFVCMYGCLSVYVCMSVYVCLYICKHMYRYICNVYMYIMPRLARNLFSTCMQSILSSKSLELLMYEWLIIPKIWDNILTIEFVM